MLTKMDVRKVSIVQRGQAILDRLPMGGPAIGAEIGVLDGRLSAFLLRSRSDLTMYLVDRWEAPQAESRYALSGSAVAQLSDLDFAIARTNAEGGVAFAGERAIICQGESVEVARAFTEMDAPADGRTRRFDFVFIDGDHTLQGVSEDLAAWYPLVRDGGLLCGHDWAKRTDHWGVAQAVIEFRLRSGIHSYLSLGPDSTWFFRKE